MGGKKRAAEELWLTPSGATAAEEEDHEALLRGGARGRGGVAPTSVDELRDKMNNELEKLAKSAEAADRAQAAARSQRIQELQTMLDSNASEASKTLSRVSALERTLAEEGLEERETLVRLQAAHKASLSELDAMYGKKMDAIRASMKRLKDMAKQAER